MMIEAIPIEIFPLLLLFSSAFLILRILKVRIKVALILAVTLTIAVPLIFSEQFDKIHALILEFGKTEIAILSGFLFLVGLIVGIKRKKVRKLSDIEILGKLEFKKADLVGKLSLAKAKRDRKAEKAIKGEIENVEKEIASLKKKLGRHI